MKAFCHFDTHVTVICTNTTGYVGEMLTKLTLQQTPANFCPQYIQWNLSVATTSIINCITCDLFSNVF